MLSNSSVSGEDVDISRLKLKAMSGSLTNFLEVNKVRRDVLSEFLASSACVSSLENVLQVLWYRADIETKSHYGRNVLLNAAERGTVEIITALLDNGANVEVHDRNGKFPLPTCSSIQ
eukprot:TRINITY_DN1541_c0_g1_i1.p1 TRINITY_DN1541_c0_g1~~TRINITY_DN1541_c0_g1_i1.p1  ORF type:complete len:118 (-),score=3.39 TRINITY_DN1541_c0_g1_i1:114-467(-)